MVSKITVFEPHFDGAQFGPTSVEGLTDSGSDTDETSADEPDESSSRPRTFLKGATVFVVMFVVLWVVFSRLTSTEEDE